MKGKLLFVAGAAVGYVLGARAGRKRYDQIKSAAAKLWESPGVQRQVEQAQDFAAARVGEVPGALIDGAKKVVSSVSNHSSDEKKSSSSTKRSGGTAKKSASTTKKPAASTRSRSTTTSDSDA